MRGGLKIHVSLRFNSDLSIASRLDTFLTSRSLREHIQSCEISPCTFSDHEFVSLVVDLKSQSKMEHYRVLSNQRAFYVKTILLWKEKYPTTWLLRRIIRHNFGTHSRGTSQQGVKQRKWWKNSTKNKWNEEAYNTGYSQVVTHPSTNPPRQGLTSVIRREPVFCLWYGRRREKGEKIWLLIPSMVNM